PWPDRACELLLGSFQHADGVVIALQLDEPLGGLAGESRRRLPGKATRIEEIDQAIGVFVKDRCVYVVHGLFCILVQMESEVGRLTAQWLTCDAMEQSHQVAPIRAIGIRAEIEIHTIRYERRQL